MVCLLGQIQYTETVVLILCVKLGNEALKIRVGSLG